MPEVAALDPSPEVAALDASPEVAALDASPEVAACPCALALIQAMRPRIVNAIAAAMLPQKRTSGRLLSSPGTALAFAVPSSGTQITFSGFARNTSQRSVALPSLP